MLAMNELARQRRVAFLTSYGGQLFVPEDDVNGSPNGFGSELALYETGRRLANYYDITVYISKDKGYQLKKWNMTWKSSQDWEEEKEQYGTIVVCRYMNIFVDYNLPGKIILWAHDPYYLPQWNSIYLGDALITNVLPSINHLVTVGTSQMMERLAPRYGIDLKKNKFTAIRNGISLEDGWSLEKVHGDRKRLSFMYCSCPTRGLMTLLDKWPAIKRAFPEATLDIYYNKHENVEKRLAEMNDSSIHYIGKVSQPELFQRMKTVDYWLYGCTFYESCCTLAVETQYYGPITICNPVGGLKENVETAGMINEQDINVWYERAIEFIKSLETNDEKKRALRTEQYNWALQQTWDHRIPQWLSVLGEN